MIAGIHQPNYIPWLGYFDKISKCDKFILLDHVLIPKQSVANRNYIKGKNGKKVLLTVPLKKNNVAKMLYNNTRPDYDSLWHQKHLNKISDAYYHSPFFKENFDSISAILMKEYDTLAKLNEELIKFCLSVLSIKTELVRSSEIGVLSLKNQQNIELCKAVNATVYLSGKGAQKYNDEGLFESNNIRLVYQDYASPYYAQTNGDFMNDLSFLDFLFCVGKKAGKEIFSQKNDDSVNFAG